MNIAAGAAAALCFVALTIIRLGAQGPYFDELHQAAGAFAHLGHRPEMFAVVQMGGYPVLNMPYSGAIKTNLYGLYLRLTGAGFDLETWRLFGIVFVAFGIVVFAALARSALPGPAMALFLALVVTDVNLLLESRFDWGPVGLAMAIRLVFVGVWLRGAAGAPSLRNSLLLGALVGFATFEKLSSWVLLLALTAIFATCRARRAPRHLLAAATGLAIGGLPLLVTNLYTFFGRSGSLVSLSAVNWARKPSLTLAQFLAAYASLGQGRDAASFTLGVSLPPRSIGFEKWAMVVALGAALAVAFWRWGESPAARRVAAALGAWLVIALALHNFPAHTAPHHWIIGTPFQYVAMALAFVAAGEATTPRPRPLGAGLVILPALLLLAGRMPTLSTIERALWAGQASQSFHPDFTALGRFAAAQGEGVVFLASDWGVSTQIYCFSNGRPRFVHSLYAGGLAATYIRQLRRTPGVDALYLVRRGAATPALAPAVTQRIEQALEETPVWREVPAEPAIAGLSAVRVRKFVPDSLQ